MKKAKVSILDCGALSRLCLASGRARAMQEYTKTNWQPDNLDDNAFMSTLYSIFPFKTKPGTLQVDTDMAKADKAGLEYARHYQEVFYRKLWGSPQLASSYAEHLHKMRRDSEEFLQRQFAEAGRINREIVDEWTNHIIGLKTAKVVSEIVVSIYAPGVAFGQGAVILGVEIIQAATMGEAGIVCAKFASKETTKASAERFAHIATKVHHAKGLKAWDLAMESNAKAKQLAESMARKSSSSKLAKLGRGLDRAKSAVATNTQLSTTALKMSKRIQLGTKFGLPILFAIPDLIDIYDEIESLN